MIKTIEVRYGPNGQYRDTVQFEGDQTITCCGREINLVCDNEEMPFYSTDNGIVGHGVQCGTCGSRHEIDWRKTN